MDWSSTVKILFFELVLYLLSRQISSCKLCSVPWRITNRVSGCKPGSSTNFLRIPFHSQCTLALMASEIRWKSSSKCETICVLWELCEASCLQNLWGMKWSVHTIAEWKWAFKTLHSIHGQSNQRDKFTNICSGRILQLVLTSGAQQPLLTQLSVSPPPGIIPLYYCN